MERIRRIACIAVVALAAAAMLPGCAGGAPATGGAGRSAGGVEVFGTVDAGVGRTR